MHEHPPNVLNAVHCLHTLCSNGSKHCADVHCARCADVTHLICLITMYWIGGGYHISFWRSLNNEFRYKLPSKDSLPLNLRKYKGIFYQELHREDCLIQKVE